MGEQAPERTTTMRATIGQNWRRWALDYGIYVILALIAIVLSLVSPHFFQSANLLNIFSQASMKAIIAIGVTMVILMAQIDLSVGSVAALAGAITAGVIQAMPAGWPMEAWLIVSIGAGLGVGALVGLVNGLFTVLRNIPSFIVTLAMLAIARGVVLLYTQGRPIFGLGEEFSVIAWADLLGIPVPVLLVLVLYLLAWLFLRETRLGRYIYAIGSNERAVELAGVNVRAIKIAVFALSGLMAGMGGIVLTSRLDSAQPTMATTWELDVIAMVVLGGTSLYGGRGSVAKTLVGALILQTIANGLNLMNVQAYWQQVTKGAVILLALFIERTLRGREEG